MSKNWTRPRLSHSKEYPACGLLYGAWDNTALLTPPTGMHTNNLSEATLAMITIRSADRDDLPGILEVYNEAVLHTTATYDYEPRTLEHRIEWFEAHRRENYPVYVGVDDESGVVGWSSLNKYHDRPGYRFTTENSIYIAPPHRGHGLGARLLAPLIESARELGFRAILAGIDAANEPSLRLHARFGFERVAHYKQVGFKFGRWLDVIYMELLLPGTKTPTPQPQH